MKERPILFSGEMVQAILAGRKTQTRRVVKPQPEERKITEPGHEGVSLHLPGQSAYKDGVHEKWIRRGEYWDCPYGKPGDRLWVRETFCIDDRPFRGGVLYRADFASPEIISPWKPSIHMPRWASRLLLEITRVRVERVREISDVDAIAEGVISKEAFMPLWDSINAVRGHGVETNPWVWVIDFKVVDGRDH
ncbi:MAG: hypothetical protein HQL97_01130 [Magnetococcales bacterium]|nr:hypothetical protein [Magnetococcales bacterium]